MESRFTSPNATQDIPRLQEVARLMGKYTTGWKCSACGRQFELNESERISIGSESCDLPSRIRRLFETHRCVNEEGERLCKQPGSVVVSADDIFIA